MSQSAFRPTPEEFEKEYGYEVNKWYDARKHYRPKVNQLLVKMADQFYKPYELGYPNGESINLENGKKPSYDKVVAWMYPYDEEGLTETKENDTQD